MAFEIPIETHLKSTFKANYKWKAPNRKIIDAFKTKYIFKFQLIILINFCY